MIANPLNNQKFENSENIGKIQKYLKEVEPREVEPNLFNKIQEYFEKDYP